MLVSGLPQPDVLATLPAGNRLTPSDIAAAALTLEFGRNGGPRNTPAPAGRMAIPPDPLRRFGHRCGRIGARRRLAAGRRGPAAACSAACLISWHWRWSECERRETATRSAHCASVTAYARRSLSSVGHDLRTPLTAIIGAAGELRRAKAKDPELLATIEGEAGKLERYISNLLDMARIEAGSVKLKTECVDLVDAVAAALKDLRAGLAGHEVSVELPPDLPLVRTDPQLLHHCLINLIDNAARYSGSAGAIHIRASSAEGGVRLTIEDQGPGLPLERERALDAFIRIEGSDRKGGAGLGLAIVKGFAEAMGANVTRFEPGRRTGRELHPALPQIARREAANRSMPARPPKILDRR